MLWEDGKEDVLGWRKKVQFEYQEELKVAQEHL
jgi:hypothetical protein